MVSRTNGTMKLYVDGALQGTTTFAADSVARDYGTQPWTFGAAAPGAPTYAWPANGSLDQVRIYRTALSATEVQALYTAGG
ncbi:LamG-like jellyroll fold domain-containing protein [Kribbella sp. GL6]|uniref:LamG-like jellyroll fold domain-containing protein n=1 Tax=Kribbella sp. GL6 TaxID=3419765 RepID=UPI003D00B8D3